MGSSTKIILEVCTASVDGCITAAAMGADRIELNAALPLGGLTPTLAVVEQSIAAIDIPIIAMLRPREGGFRYSDTEFAAMQRDADLLLERNVAGLAFGILKEDGTIDEKRCDSIIKQCEGRDIVFHRAFDVTPQPIDALETLIDLGITRVLTSGQADTAPQGAATIRELITRAAGRIEILPGCGINPDNVRSLIRQTDCTQIHGSFSQSMTDPTASINPAVSFGPPDGDHLATDGHIVAKMREIVCHLQ